MFGKNNSLDKLNPLLFEAAIAILLEKKFKGNSLLTPQTNDKGAYIIFFGNKNNLLVQVKQSKNKLNKTQKRDLVLLRKEAKQNGFEIKIL